MSVAKPRVAGTYDTRTTFRRLRARATPAAARVFRRTYYGRTVRSADRRVPLTWACVPEDYDVQIRAVEALVLNRHAIGFDANPLACLVATEIRLGIIPQPFACATSSLPHLKPERRAEVDPATSRSDCHIPHDGHVRPDRREKHAGNNGRCASSRPQPVLRPGRADLPRRAVGVRQDANRC